MLGLRERESVINNVKSFIENNKFLRNCMREDLIFVNWFRISGKDCCKSEVKVSTIEVSFHGNILMK